MKATTYCKLKRLLSLLLVLCMTMSGMSLEAFATGETGPTKSVTTTKDDVTLVKTISDQKEDGSYDLTIESYAEGGTSLKHMPMDIVLVLDTSGSMEENLDVKGQYAADTGSFSYSDVVGNSYYYKDSSGSYEVKGVANSTGWASSYCYLYIDKGNSRYYLTGSSLVLAKDKTTPTYCKGAILVGESGKKAVAADGKSIEPVYGSSTDIYTGTLYHRASSTIEKLDALKTTVNSLIDSVAADAKEYGVEHKIAIVEFASKTYVRKELTTVVDNATALKKVVSGFSAGGATRADLGMGSAYDILKASSGKDKVVIFVTDGGPTEGSTTANFFESGRNYDSEAVGKANNTITNAAKIKGLGGYIYSIGIFSQETMSVKTFLSAVSNDYMKAESMTKLGTVCADPHYYKTVTNSQSLQNLFDGISREIIENSTILDADSVLTDYITDEFEVIGQPTVAIAKRTGDKTWGTAVAADSDVSASYDKNTHSVIVTGFDYVNADNLIVKTSSGWQGNKLVITVNLKLKDNVTVTDDFIDTNKNIEIKVDNKPVIEMEKSPEVENKGFDVSYSWTGLPSNSNFTVPAGTTGHKGESVDVDTTYTAGMVVQDKDGHAYQFSGWSQTGTITLENDVEITGEWTTATRSYTINFYKQDEAEVGDYNNYKLAETETSTAEVYESFYPGSKDGAAENSYESKYAAENYSYAAGSPKGTIAATGANVLNLYYNKDTVKYTITRIFKLKVFNADGSEDNFKYTIKDDFTGNIGEEAEIEPEATYMNGEIEYALKAGTPSTMSIVLDRDNSKNVFELEYSAEQDYRADATVQVKHYYRTWGYVLDAQGRFGAEPVVISTSDALDSNPKNNNTYKASTSYTVSTAEKTPLAAYADYVLNTEDSTLSKSKLAANENVFNLYFDKAAADLTSANITVKYHYTKSVTYIDENGAVQSKLDPDNHVETVSPTGYYVGEKFTASEVLVYGGTTYTADEANASKLTINALAAGSNEINLYYTASQAPAKASVTVVHKYYNVENDSIVEAEALKSEKTYNDCYVGQKFTAQYNIEEGYTFEESYKEIESSAMEITVSAEGNTITLNYFKDNRGTGKVALVYKYTTHLETIVNGQVGYIDSSESVQVASYENKVGEPYSFPEPDEEVTYKNEDWKKASATGLSGTLSLGQNTSALVEYKRSASNLVGTTYKVNYVYKYNKQYIDNGVAKMCTVTDTDLTNTVTVTENCYVGQSVSFSAGGADGYKITGTAPATTQILAASGNEWTFEYIKEEDILLGEAKVVVKHNYTTHTINESNVNTDSTNVVTLPAAEKVNGETFVAAAVPGDFTYVSYTVTEGTKDVGQDEATKNVILTADGTIEVNFFYEKTVDNSVPATYIIVDVYEAYTWNNHETPSITTRVERGNGNANSSFKGVEIETSAIKTYGGLDYEIVDVKCNDTVLVETSDETYIATMDAGSNVIVYTYKCELAKELVGVTVKHNYYLDADATTTEAYFVDESATVTEGDSFSATPITEYTFDEGTEYSKTIKYQLVKAEPASQKIDSVLKGNGNMITFDYVRITKTVTINAVDEEEKAILGADGKPVVYEINVPYGTSYSVSYKDLEDLVGDCYIPFKYYSTSGAAIGDNNVEETWQYYTDKGPSDNPEDDPKPNGYPDSKEAQVKFTVVNGTWVGETNTTKTVLYLLAEKNATTGEWTDITPAPTLGTIPTGLANNGYGHGQWNVEPATGDTPVDGKEYTLTYSKNPNINIIAVDEELQPFSGVLVNSISVAYGDNYNITSNNLPIVSGYAFEKFVDPSQQSGTMGDADIDVKVIYSQDIIGPNNDPEDPSYPEPNKPDNVPDKYQAVVRFVVENGEWTNVYDGLVRVYNLYEKNEETLTWTTIAGVTIGAIPTHVAKAGYNEGSWDQTPEATARPVEGTDTTYTYTYNKGQYTITIVPVVETEDGIRPIVGATPGAITATYGAIYTIGNNDLPYVPGYAPDRFVNPEEQSGTMGNENTEVQVIYEQDIIGPSDDPNNPDPNKPDNIPDKYQAVVRFAVENGHWTEEKPSTVRVYTLYQKDETTLTWTTIPGITIGQSPAHAPENGYNAGSWNPAFDSEARPEEGTDTTYTYTYGKDMYTITIVPVVETEDGIRPIVGATPGAITATYGAIYTIGNNDLPNVPGYVPDRFVDPEKQTGTMGNENTEVQVIYEPDIIGPSDDPNDPEPNKPDNIPDKYQAVVTFNVTNGTWDGTNGKTTVKQVYTFKEKTTTGEWVDKTTSLVIPASTSVDAETYKLKKWLGTAPEAGTSVTTAAVYNLKYFEDKINEDDPYNPGPDDIPDEWQAVVTYYVVNGTWQNDSKAPIKNVYTIKDDGVLLPEAQRVLSGIPAGMKAAAGYKAESGSWNVADLGVKEIIVSGDLDYTYTFGEKQSNPPVNPPIEGDDDDDDDTDIVDEDVPLADIPSMLFDGHIAYVFGYPDGTVRPTNNITRAEVATIFYHLLQPAIREANMTSECSFTDVKGNEWFATPIATMSKLGILAGYPDGSFKPNDYITRAELATIAANFSDYLGETDKTFTDISNSWAKTFIEKAATLGWVAGYPDGTFKPNDYITRAETMALVNNVLQRCPASPEDLLDTKAFWPDNSNEKAWYYLAVEEATTDHDYEYREDGTEYWVEPSAEETAAE